MRGVLSRRLDERARVVNEGERAISEARAKAIRRSVFVHALFEVDAELQAETKKGTTPNDVVPERNL